MTRWCYCGGFLQRLGVRLLLSPRGKLIRESIDPRTATWECIHCGRIYKAHLRQPASWKGKTR